MKTIEYDIERRFRSDYRDQGYVENEVRDLAKQLIDFHGAA